jgi:murein DD-endopeptidase MepM/ murein hydrolase activator NlpD
MKIFISMAAFFMFSACAQTKAAQSGHTISPGEIRIVEFPKAANPKVFCRDLEVKSAVVENQVRVVVVDSYFSDLSPFTCRLDSNGKTVSEIKFTVEKREYKAERLKVDQKKIKLAKKDEERVWREQKVLDKIYASSVPEFFFKEGFIEPMNSFVTSIYGTKRIYNNQKHGQHLGIDYRAAIGEKVPAAGSGKIVFSGDLFYTGWTVIIDHGMDIFTVYGHLSKTLVKDGDVIKRGELIGLSGATGRVSGPHLHWGVKIQGQYMDGMSVIAETKKIFKE